jgi:hypothetical protein
VISPFQLVVETHPSGATAYVSGPLSLAVAARTIAACCRLPSLVRAIAVDLHAVTVWDADALLLLESLLVEWAHERRGVHRITHPRTRPRDAFVAIPCAIRDAPDAQLRPSCDDRVFSTPPLTRFVT